MHKWRDGIETMRILETMKIKTRKKKKSCEMKLKHRITVIVCLKMGNHFVDYSIFRNGHLRDSPPFYILFFSFSPFLELVTIDETFEKIREGDPRSLEQLFVRDELRKNEEADLFVRIIIIR